MNKKKIKIAILLTAPAILFILLSFYIMQLGIELQQNGSFKIAFYTIILSVLLFIISTMYLLFVVLKIIFRSKIVAILCFLACFFPTLFFSSAFLYANYKIILNTKRPTDPNRFISNRPLVTQLTSFSEELIQKQNVFWVGNGWDHFIFGITYCDSNFRFHSDDIPENHNFAKPIPSEDAAKVEHLDLPFQPGHQRTGLRVLDPNDYAFCKRASALIRRVGFHNVKLYHEDNIVQFQIYDFCGWDSGRYYIYYFSKDGTLPIKFEYDRKLNDNWYYDVSPRF